MKKKPTPPTILALKRPTPPTTLEPVANDAPSAEPLPEKPSIEAAKYTPGRCPEMECGGECLGKQLLTFRTGVRKVY